MNASWTAETAWQGDYADVNGIRLYHESRGTGRPLILLHGGLGSGEMFGPVRDRLAEAHRVIAIDLQGHGRTADVDRPMSVVTLGDDIAALIGHLGLDRADVMGYSLGGGTALQTAARHPELVRRLILVSTNLRTDAFYPDMRAQQAQVSGAMADAMKGTPMYELYQRVAPRPEDFPRLLDKMGAWMAEPFDASDDLRGIRVPTMIVAGDADIFPPRHAVEAFELLGGGQRDGGWMAEGRPQGGHALAILPGVQHYTIFASPLLAEVAIAFLDAGDA